MGMHASASARVSVPAFADRVFEHLPRTDQRRWARAYLQSLLVTPGKKSVRRLAAAISDSPTASQSLHQFVNASPWDWMPVREELIRWAEQRMCPQAWVVDLAVLRKRGEHSCGVHRRFVPSTGRSVTCQVGIGAFLTAHDAAVPVDWRLLLPGSWSRDPERRRRTRIPDGVVARPIEHHALDLIDTLAGAGRAVPVPVVADLGTSPGAGDLIRGLALRNHDFVIAVPDSFRVVVGRHLRVQRRYGAGEPGVEVTARNLLRHETGGLSRVEQVAAGTGRDHHTTVRTGFVHLPWAAPAGAQPVHTYQMFTVRPKGDRRPSRLWLTNLTRTRAEERIALTRLLSRTAESVRRMEEDFGLLDFEGRSYPGWHHHMTLVSAAYAYHRLGAPAESALAAV